MEILYCGGCGTRLREDDFSRGKARMMDNRPWCAECKPPDKAPIPAAAPSRRQGSSAKHPRITPEMVRPDPAGVRRKQLQLLLIVGGGVVLVIILAMVVLLRRP